MSGGPEQRRVPAAGFKALRRFHDPIVELTSREEASRSRLLDAVTRALPEGGTALDVGCGTGTFAIRLAAARPDATVIGIDGDPDAPAIARAKPGAERVDWREASPIRSRWRTAAPTRSPCPWSCTT